MGFSMCVDVSCSITEPAPSLPHGFSTTCAPAGEGEAAGAGGAGGAGAGGAGGAVVPEAAGEGAVPVALGEPDAVGAESLMPDLRKKTTIRTTPTTTRKPTQPRTAQTMPPPLFLGGGAGAA